MGIIWKASREKELALEVADIADRISDLFDRMWKGKIPPWHLKLRVIDYIVKAIDPCVRLKDQPPEEF